MGLNSTIRSTTRTTIRLDHKTRFNGPTYRYMRIDLLGITTLPCNLMVLILATVNLSLGLGFTILAARLMSVASRRALVKFFDQSQSAATSTNLLRRIWVNLDCEPFVVPIDKSQGLALHPSLRSSSLPR